MRRGLAILLCAVAIGGMISGCGSSQEQVVTVQSVAMLSGLTDEMQKQTFAGIVSTGNEANVKKDSTKKVASVYVKKGDIVKQGDKLFTYDAEQAQNSLDKARLELEELKNTLVSKQEEKATYEKDKKKAKKKDQMEYTLKIAETDTDIRETQYNIGLKEKEIVKLEEGTKNLDVTAPIAGMVQKAGQADASLTEYAAEEDEEDEDDFGSSMDDEGSGDVFIKIVEVDNYRVKGTIDETNISVITTGMQMKIHSRVDDSQVWYGVVSDIDLKSPGKNSNNNSYYGSDEGDDTEMTTTSKYPFYVKLDGLEGLLIGQHVYMTEYLPEEEDQQIELSASFIVDPEGDSWVWAEKDGALEKRSVTVGGYIDDEDLYIIEEGLSADDYIAVPEEDFKEGTPVTEISQELFDAAEEGKNKAAAEGDDEEWTEEDDGEWTEEDDGEWTEEDDEEWTEEDDEEWTEEDEADAGLDVDKIEARYQAAGEEIVG